MLKICEPSIRKPLEIILKSCLENGIFPLEWKKANIVPIQKENDKQSLANYRPISLLPICGKIFERLLYNEMFNFFITNHLLFPRISQALNLETLVSISSYQLPMEYMRRLMRDMKFEVSFLTYQRHLIRFGMKVSSLSQNKMEYLENCYVS